MTTDPDDQICANLIDASSRLHSAAAAARSNGQPADTLTQLRDQVDSELTRRYPS